VLTKGSVTEPDSTLQPVKIFATYLFKIYFNIILLSVLKSHKWPLILKGSYTFQGSPANVTCSVNFILLDLITVTVFIDEYKL